MRIYVPRSFVHLCYCAVIAIFALALVNPSQGAPAAQTSTPSPRMFAYHGTLRDPAGNLLSGTFKLMFRLYNTPGAGTAIWTETQPQVSVRGGDFSVMLGSIAPLDASFFVGNDLYIGITLDGYEEMTPRQRLASVPYAMTVLPEATVNNARGGNVKLAPGINGIIASSTAVNGIAIRAEQLSNNNGYAFFGDVISGATAIYGRNNGTGGAINGSAVQGNGVEGLSRDGVGVIGTSTNNDGLVGKSGSPSKSGIWGVNPLGYGIYGQTDSGRAGTVGKNFGAGDGIQGISDGGTGVYGHGARFGGYFDGAVQVNGHTSLNGSTNVYGPASIDGTLYLGSSVNIKGRAPILIKRITGLGSASGSTAFGEVNTGVSANDYECVAASWTVLINISSEGKHRHSTWTAVNSNTNTWWLRVQHDSDDGSTGDYDVLCFRREMTEYQGNRLHNPQ